MVSSGNRTVAFFILLIAGIFFGAEVHAENTTFLTYNDTKEGFSISYPEGASLQYAADADMSEVSVLTPENITMIRIDARKTRDSLENLTESMLTSHTFLPDGKIQESGKKRLGGTDAFFIDYQWTREGIPVRSYVITTVNNGTQYSISYDNRAENYQDDKVLIDQLIDTFTFILKESTEKYNTGYPYYPGTVYDNFGMPMSDYGQYNWNPYANNYWDGSTGYYYPSTNYNQFPMYTGYDPYGQGYQQYPQPTMMPTMGYTIAPTMMPTIMPTMRPITSPTTVYTPRPTVQPSHTVQQVSGADIEKLVEDGFDYLVKNQYKQAEAKFKAAIQMDDTDFRAHYGYAKTLFYGFDGKEETALEELNLAISTFTEYWKESDSTTASLYTVKADIEKFLKKYDDALESVEMAISHEKDDASLANEYNLKAKILYLSDAPPEQALEAAEQAASLDPTNENYQELVDSLKEAAGTGTSGGSVYPSVAPVHATTGTTGYSGGDGSSMEKAVIITGTTPEWGSVEAENGWVEDHYGKRNTDWKFDKVTFISNGGHHYDKFEVTLADDSPEVIWFDITDSVLNNT